MKILIVIVFFAGAVLLSAHASAVAQKERGMTRCTVVDPTGSPLNVRSSPNGKKIVSKLKNGTSVFLEKYGDDAEGREWVLVRLTGKKVSKSLGWVLKNFLECE